MAPWKSAAVALLALLTPSALSHAGHHDPADIVPEEKREELLKKWDQEVV